MITIPKHFKAQELVDPFTYERWGINSLRYMDTGLLLALDWIWENYPSEGTPGNPSARAIQINDWVFGGAHKSRGLRLPPDFMEMDPVTKEWIRQYGSNNWKAFSAHSSGRGADMVPQYVKSMDVMRTWILNTHEDIRREGHLDHPLLAIRRMEIGTPTWVHLDTLQHQEPGILMVNP